MSATTVIPGFVIATIPTVGLQQERNAWNVVVAALPRHLPNHDHGPADWCDEDLAEPIGTPVPRDWHGREIATLTAPASPARPEKIKVAKLASGGMLHPGGEDNPVLGAKRTIIALTSVVIARNRPVSPAPASPRRAEVRSAQRPVGRFPVSLRSAELCWPDCPGRAAA